MSKKYLDLAGLSSYDQKIKEYIDDGDVTIDSTLTQAGQAADAKKVGDEISDVKSAITDIVDTSIDITDYFYKKNTYIRNGVDTTLNGYDTYYVPIGTLDYAEITWNPQDTFYVSLTAGYVFNSKNSDDTITSLTNTARTENYALNLSAGIVGFRGKTIKGIYFTVKQGLENKLQLAYNSKRITLKNFEQRQTIEILKDNTPYPNSKVYFDNSGLLAVNISASDYYYCIKMPVKVGDKFIFGELAGGFNYYGTLLYNGGYDVIYGSNKEYTVLHDGIVALNNSVSDYIKTMYIPVDSPKTYVENIFGGNPYFSNNPYAGKKGVAFGTSLTYRGQAGQTGGYLNYLPELSEMTWDNQGVDSSTIYGNDPTTILNKILGYTDYTDKDIVIVEGFVNDFYTECPLGIYTDTGTNSVCGCLRSAIAHILTENKTATIFVVLDHYGKGITAEDVVKNNETQFTYYEECAKVCESMGVYAIKEYALSGINSYSDQFLRDNIHCNDLGAKQSAQTIWNYMITHNPKAQS